MSHVLEGGTQAWEAAGYVLFSGVNVPSKAFGEWVEHHYGTESVDAPELKSWLDAGRDMVVLDSRPLEEFRRMSIPTGDQRAGRRAGLPHRRPGAGPGHAGGGELRRAHAQHPGRGEPAPGRHAQPGGGAAQRHDGLGAGRAARASAGGPTRYPAGHAAAPPAWRSSGPRASPRRSGVGVIGPLDLARFEEDPDRTLYVLDVRDPAEFAAGHRPGQPQRAGRPARAGDGPLDRRARRPHRAARR